MLGRRVRPTSFANEPQKMLLSLKIDSNASYADANMFGVQGEGKVLGSVVFDVVVESFMSVAA